MEGDIRVILSVLLDLVDDAAIAARYPTAAVLHEGVGPCPQGIPLEGYNGRHEDCAG
jgi:hypothetical protein